MSATLNPLVYFGCYPPTQLTEKSWKCPFQEESRLSTGVCALPCELVGVYSHPKGRGILQQWSDSPHVTQKEAPSYKNKRGLMNMGSIYMAGSSLRVRLLAWFSREAKRNLTFHLLKNMFFVSPVGFKGTITKMDMSIFSRGRKRPDFCAAQPLAGGPLESTSPRVPRSRQAWRGERVVFERPPGAGDFGISGNPGAIQGCGWIQHP